MVPSTSSKRNWTLVESFFKYARDRENIRLKREAGEPPPWTTDPILGRYRFCNIFREDDVTTKWIKENLRDPLRKSNNVFFAMTAARLFNRIEVLEKIADPLRNPTDTVLDQIRNRLKGVQPVVTGAYIVKTPDDMVKLEGVLMILKPALIHMRELEHSAYLRTTHSRLMEYPYIGSFIAYEIVTDLRHTDFLCNAPDITTWAAAGPGAARGLARVYEKPINTWNHASGADQDIMLELMQQLLQYSKMNEHWPKDWPKWEMREVEHTLCEFDKYERSRLGEGRPKQRFSFNPKRK